MTLFKSGVLHMSNEKYEKGLQIRTQVLGEDYVNR